MRDQKIRCFRLTGGEFNLQVEMNGELQGGWRVVQMVATSNLITILYDRAASDAE